MLRRIIAVDLTNVSREEQQELREYLELSCWKWKENLKDSDD